MIYLITSVLYKLFVCVYLTFFLPYFLLFLYFLSYLFTSLLVCLLNDLSISSRTGPFHFQARDSRRPPNLALVFWFVLCCNIFCYGCVFDFFVFVSVFQY